MREGDCLYRRVLDNITLDAIDKDGDEEILSYVLDKIGAGTETTNPKTKPVVFDSSLFGLPKNGLSNVIKKLSSNYVSYSDSYYIIDSMGNEHIITKDCLAIIKALLLYSIVCNPILSRCILEAVREINNVIIGRKDINSAIITEYNDSIIVDDITNSKLMKYTRDEIRSMFKEAGVTIDGF